MVIPLPKCNNPIDPSELRPVSLLPIIGKKLEKLIHLQLSEFLEETGKLSKLQDDFRKGHSTTSATSKFIDDIALGLDRGFHTLAVFLDIKKAFDTIDHNILIRKLKHAGDGENTVLLLQNYLQNRKQCVLYNGEKSNIRSLSTGVPQGSTLGPLLFLLYINDLPCLFDQTKCMMFADDTVLYQTNDNVQCLYDERQGSLDKMQRWCENNQITLNSKKCEYIYFCYRKPSVRHLKLKLGSNILR